MSKKKLAVFLLCVLLTALCASFLSYKLAEHLRNGEETKQLQKEAYADNAASDKKSGAAEALSEEGSSQTEKNPIDFDNLQASNPDLFAWIQIPDTEISYPVAQHPSDDSYYLSHGADGGASEYGCPYIELADGQGFTEFNTVIYGHNMNDGSMFGGLHQFEDPDYLMKHRSVKIYTPNHIYTYTIFAAVMYSDAHIPYYYDDNSETDRKAFLTSLRNDTVADRSQYLNDIEVTSQDHIITLSTCDRTLRNNRYLVAAVMTQMDGHTIHSGS